jgi:hypothetical protein
MTEPTTPESFASAEVLRKFSAADSPDLLSDCQIMLRFALKEGLTLPNELRHDVAALDQHLVKMQLTPISAMPSVLFAAPSATESLSSNELLLQVHGALSQVIAPATALTLQVSEPPPGKRQFLGGLPVLVKRASWVALACAAGFVLTSIPSVTEKVAEAKQPITPAQGSTPTPGSPTPANPSP